MLEVREEILTNSSHWAVEPVTLRGGGLPFIECIQVEASVGKLSAWQGGGIKHEARAITKGLGQTPSLSSLAPYLIVPRNRLPNWGGSCIIGRT